ncbi:MAG TPA: hypothetical protein VE174_14485 [Actinomycetota bacterium]|nr:hypothetical protein [Actinomycetota bacterium]
MKDLIGDLTREARFARTEPYQRVAYVCGGLLLLSAIFHGVVFFVDGGPWEGPISWRKPILFGFSFGITLVTLAWVVTFLNLRKLTGWIALGVLSLAGLGEVGLITMQKWRGVESHFNESTKFDSAVFGMMGFLVSLMGLVIAFVAVRAFIKLDATPSLAWAIRLGLLLLLVSQGVGVSMIIQGGNTFGAAGPIKVPHAVTLHAAQVLPALALLLRLSEMPEERRVRIVIIAAIGYSGLIAATFMQTYSGRGTLDIGLASSVVALTGLTLLTTSGLFALQGIRARLAGPSF